MNNSTFSLIDKSIFLRSFKVIPEKSFDILLGSGASISAGIPTGGDLVWWFKKEILAAEGKIDGNLITNLNIESNKRLIQNFIDPAVEKTIKNPYSYYFEKCYPDAQVRNDFLTSLTKDKKPTIGHLCLSALIEKARLSTVWTTNFDDLIEKALYSMNISCETISTKDSASISKYRIDIPQVVKLHGDFKYDSLQNTDEELQRLEKNLSDYFVNSSRYKGLIVIGYSGYDESILKALNQALNQDNPFPRGLVWCLRKGEQPSDTLRSMVHQANKQNNKSGFMYIDSFDYFLYELYSAANIKNETIDKLAKENFNLRKPFQLNSNRDNTPLMFNAIKVDSYPKSFFVAKTNIKDWTELRTHLADTNIVGALSKGYTYLMGEEGAIKTIFGRLSTTAIEYRDVPEKYYYEKESFYIGLLYDLIEKSLTTQYNLSLYGRGRSVRKVYSQAHLLNQEDFTHLKKKLPSISQSIQIFEAFEYKVEFINKELFLIINPCVHIQNTDGTEVKKEIAQCISNIIYSNRYNSTYGKKLMFWIDYLHKVCSNLSFSLGEFKIKLSSYYSTSSIIQKDIHSFDSVSKISEPYIYFHHHDDRYKTTHPISGLSNMGPLDQTNQSFAAINLDRIKLGIISPAEDFLQVKEHLLKLNQSSYPKWEKDYLREYPGFEQIYHKKLYIPDKNSEDVILISTQETSNVTIYHFYEILKKKIDKFAERFTELDCVIIYIPTKWKMFRECKTLDVYFDLHDSLKLYCVKKNIKVQFIEDKSINYSDIAKVMWWLSLGIYVKANGTPWKIITDEENTAFVGLGYALRQNAKNKVVLGSSQLFDNNGQGLKFLLQPIERPIFYNKNPFMSKDDAFRLVNNIRNTYNRIDPIKGLDKIVIHKTTRFTNEEIEGINNALTGVDDVELLQIQQTCNWRALKLYKKANGRHDFGMYPIERGTIVQLDEYNFLLWTHGVVEGPEFSKSYYQGKRGIPAPLLVTRFLGKDPIEKVASDILKFTKMNWNGAELYKTLPVTIDFSKRLSVMGKQLEELGVKPYDFRYFI